ncbi:MAG: glycosyltransferase family 1 protein [Candidatus Omnitrophota bacterium]
MKILYDFQAFSIQRFGGVSRYFCELINHFGDDPDLVWELPIRWSDNEYLCNLKKSDGGAEGVTGSCRGFLKRLNFRGKRRMYQLKNRPWAIERIRTSEYDIFHPTFYDDYFLKYLFTKPFVLTIHDMIHEIYPDFFSPADPTSNRKKILVQKATRIIAISKTTKKDLIDVFKVPEDKITVIYHGNSLAADVKPVDFQPIKNLPIPYLLFVGARVGYKNFYFFLRSIAALLLANPELRVVCAGSVFTAEENRFFKSLGLTGRIRQYAVDDACLTYLYQNARAFVFPSLYEGFGFPVLEAFSCGCPAILSMAGSLPEIGGDAAIYFDPKDGYAIREAVSRVIGDEDIRKELIRKGKTRANDFSWEKTARMTKQVYAEVLAC